MPGVQRCGDAPPEPPDQHAQHSPTEYDDAHPSGELVGVEMALDQIGVPEVVEQEEDRGVGERQEEPGDADGARCHRVVELARLGVMAVGTLGVDDRDLRGQGEVDRVGYRLLASTMLLRLEVFGTGALLFGADPGLFGGVPHRASGMSRWWQRRGRTRQRRGLQGLGHVFTIGRRSALLEPVVVPGRRGPPVTSGDGPVGPVGYRGGHE